LCIVQEAENSSSGNIRKKEDGWSPRVPTRQTNEIEQQLIENWRTQYVDALRSGNTGTEGEITQNGSCRIKKRKNE